MPECKVCGGDPCEIGGFPEGAPFTSVVADGDIWVNVPISLNWNWWSVRRGGTWCWGDLEHATWPAAPQPVEVGYEWGCDGCGMPWPFFEPLDFAHLLQPGHAGGGVPCAWCGKAEWPRPLGFACTCDPTPGAPDAGRNPDCKAGGLPG